MIDAVREKVKQFLRNNLELKGGLGEEIRIVGVESANGGWVVQAEVAERDLTLPGHRVFGKGQYVVRLTADLQVTSYKQVKGKKEGEGE
jgi:hypothetical protein